MDVRYGANARDVRRYDTTELREEFVIEKLFGKDKLAAVYSHIDRVITIGIMPVEKSIVLDEWVDTQKELGVDYFLERRELGIVNLGGTGTVEVDSVFYKLECLNALYVGKECRSVVFKADDAANPPKFYASSAPAHHKFDTKLVTLEMANKVDTGSFETSNKRIIYQLIHPAVLDTCQLSMGCTILDKGCVWNTLPCHTHERRMEVYLYFNMDEENAVFHMMGEGTEVRTVIMKNEQAVISPSWSIHAGCGSSNYSFIWSMAGENRTFTDMDHINIKDMR